jgi:fructose-1,6-bisphosphatase II / sedoheptulose-1,7-bisphosphatase
MFAASGVTDGSMLRGVRRWNSGFSTESIIMRSKTGTVRTISAEHNISKKSIIED